MTEGRSRWARWRPWLQALVLWLVCVLFAGVALWQMRQQTEASQSSELALLSTALADGIERGLRGAEGGMRALGVQLERGHLPWPQTEAAQALRTSAALMHPVRSVWLLDRQGHLLAGSDASPAPDVRTFLPALAGLPDDGVAVSRPYIDSATNVPLVAMAVPLRSFGDQHGGWILAAVPAKQLLGAFDDSTVSAHDRVGVYRVDGVRLAGVHLGPEHADEALMAKRLNEPPVLGMHLQSDGSRRVVGVRDVPRYGLKVWVSRDLALLLEDWRGAVVLAGVALALLFVVTMGAVAVILRADRRRARAQQALQAQQGRAGRLEALGTLAGGVAHDFNNVLAAIVGFGEMAQDAAPPGSAQARHLHTLMQAALRGKALVERILSFSRGGARSAVVFELEPVVTEVMSMVGASLRPGVRLERQLDVPGARVRGDPTRLFEALLNLCTNAVQVTASGSAVRVALTRHRALANSVLSHGQLGAGDYLMLSVSDQGPGVPPDVMEHLFEPFFTTRGAQGGTGLGLAVVHGVVAEVGGAIDVQNLQQGGARFTLYLPESRLPAVAPHEPLPVQLRGAGQCVLVLDDEAALAELAEEMLAGLGYAPIAFTDPVAALDTLRAGRHAVAAIVTDEVMPSMTGTQFIEALRPEFPRLPVVLVSGYGGALLAARAAGAGASRVLAKPVQRAELAAVLAELLN
jgi:signal transduction histidine kinase